MTLWSAGEDPSGAAVDTMTAGVGSLAHRKVLLDDMGVCLDGWVGEWMELNR